MQTAILGHRKKVAWVLEAGRGCVECGHSFVALRLIGNLRMSFLPPSFVLKKLRW